MRFPIEEDIRRARALPSEAYTDEGVFRACKEAIFGRTWQLAADTDAVRDLPACPFALQDVPLLLTREPDGRLHALSNVCTHRGNLLLSEPGRAIRCRYHGRRFALDGRFVSMPEFEGALDFPQPSDDLPRVPHGTFGKLVFASLRPAAPFEEVMAPVRARTTDVPLGDAALDPSRSRDYLVHANWALYVDNFLEGLHIPFVHPGLAGAIDYGSYETELFAYVNVQTARDSSGAVAARYFWIFPSTMLNVYPWGISVNVVEPLAVDRTRVRFRSYVWDASKLGEGAGAELDRVEREDEAIVEAVQRGIRSPLYSSGRYSPSRETGVHHFHRLFARFMEGQA
jgi:choline monooxygenase